ncbi:MAG: DUF3990 domain-containing protein [Planctomycetia bacterium]|nr:DUF3990 domain-containing protein [Planctomycetia bacterium]
MIIYHGAKQEIAKPDIFHSLAKLDFGKGFYTTTLLSQAEQWVEHFLRNQQQGIINFYTLDDSVWTEAKVLIFDTYSDNWLDLITKCRRGFDTSDYDLIVGGVANDKIFNTCELYFKKYIDKETALRRLRYENPNQQICFKNQEILDRYLLFERSEQR